MLDTDQTNLIPSLKGDGADTVIPGTVNNVRKALALSGGERKTRARDQALSSSRLLVTLFILTGRDSIASSTWLLENVRKMFVETAD